MSIDKFFTSRRRIVFSRIIALFIVLFWLNSSSYWQETHPLVASLLFMVGVMLLALGAFGRMWCSLYIAGYKNQKLVTAGPYSMMRNPLYFFSMLGFIGFGFLTKSIILPIVFGVIFVMYYINVMRKEERDLSRIFGAEYKTYQGSVPLFFPKISLFKDVDSYEVKPKVYFTHLKSAIWFVWLIGIVYVIETLKDLGYFSQWVILW